MFGNNNQDPDEYLGNIFGWKLSFIGLGVILLLSGIAAYRTYMLDAEIGFEEPASNLDMRGDTIKISQDTLQ
jgi:predicted MFS family arabinose efflux permease